MRLRIALAVAAGVAVLGTGMVATAGPGDRGRVRATPLLCQ